MFAARGPLGPLLLLPLAVAAESVTKSTAFPDKVALATRCCPKTFPGPKPVLVPEPVLSPPVVWSLGLYERNP